MMDLRLAGMSLLASSSFLLAAPVLPGTCAGPGTGSGGSGSGGSTGGSSPVAACGNGKQESTESCDGTDLGGLSPLCTEWDVSGYYSGGTIKCTNDCKFDLSGCAHPVCGDGKIEGEERCEGTSFRSDVQRACTAYDSIGFFGGTVVCGSDCQVDFSQCIGPVCGDAKIEGYEQCEGTQFIAAYAGKRCTDIPFPYPMFPLIPVNYGGGALRCGANCNVDFSECKPVPGCYVVPRFGLTCY